MFPILPRLFLLLLLGCDWAADPYQGESPLSPSLGSQEAFCHSLVYRQTLHRQLTAGQWAPETTSAAHCSPPLLPSLALPADPSPPGMSGTDLVYILKTLRR
jgi:hypothetical protein